MTIIQKLTGLGALLMFLISPAWANGQANQEIGRIYEGKPYRDQLQGSLSDEVVAPCRFAQHSDAPGLENHDILIAECDGRRAQAWLSKVNKLPKDGKRGEYEVVDFLSLGTLKNGEFVVAPVCLMDNLNSHYNWMAIYRNEKPGKERKKYTHKNGGVVQAWVVNPVTRRFELASPSMLKKMVCEPELYD